MSRRSKVNCVYQLVSDLSMCVSVGVTCVSMWPLTIIHTANDCSNVVHDSMSRRSELNWVYQ